MTILDVEWRGHVATLALNRPKALNALDRALIGESHTTVRGLASDSDVRAVIVTGRGRAFCVGLDLTEGRTLDTASARELIAVVSALQDDLEVFPVPVIAAIEGYALGSGLEVALACDLRVAAVDAEFGLPEVRLGRFPGGGGTQRLPRLAAASLAREIIFTGRRFGAAEAEGAGLLTRMVPRGEALSVSHEIAGTIAANAPLGVRAAKTAFARAHVDAQAALAHDREAWARLHDSKDYREGMAAVSEKRPPNFTGR